MGGLAFPTLNMCRIPRDLIVPTIEDLVAIVNSDQITVEYCLNNFLGSALKQDDSGDIDIVLDHNIFLRDEVFGQITNTITGALGNQHIRCQSINDPQIMVAFPIHGRTTEYIQVDFIHGNANWMKFTHNSPGKDNSPYKGAVIQTLLMMLPKIDKEFVLYDDNGLYADVGLIVGTTDGLYRQWRIRQKRSNAMQTMSADEWESSLKHSPVPRFARIGYITDPDVALRLILKGEYTSNDVFTFEQLWRIVVSQSINGKLPDHNVIKETLIDTLCKLALRKDYTREDMYNWDVWK